MAPDYQQNPIIYNNRADYSADYSPLLHDNRKKCSITDYYLIIITDYQCYTRAHLLQNPLATLWTWTPEMVHNRSNDYPTTCPCWRALCGSRETVSETRGVPNHSTHTDFPQVRVWRQGNRLSSVGRRVFPFSAITFATLFLTAVQFYIDRWPLTLCTIRCHIDRLHDFSQLNKENRCSGPSPGGFWLPDPSRRVHCACGKLRFRKVRKEMSLSG